MQISVRPLFYSLAETGNEYREQYDIYQQFQECYNFLLKKWISDVAMVATL